MRTQATSNMLDGRAEYWTRKDLRSLERLKKRWLEGKLDWQKIWELKLAHSHRETTEACIEKGVHSLLVPFYSPSITFILSQVTAVSVFPLLPHSASRAPSSCNILGAFTRSPTFVVAENTERHGTRFGLVPFGSVRTQSHPIFNHVHSYFEVQIKNILVVFIRDVYVGY